MSSFNERMARLSESHQSAIERFLRQLDLCAEATEIMAADMRSEIARLTSVHGPTLAEETLEDLPAGIRPDGDAPEPGSFVGYEDQAAE